LLVTVVDESPSLPPEVVDIIVAQFLRADPRSVASATKGKKGSNAPAIDDRQSTLLMKELPPAYNMAKTICNSCPEKLARYISQYFNDVIIDASTSKMDGASKGHAHRRASDVYGDSDDDDGPKGPTEEDLKELYKAHKL